VGASLLAKAVYQLTMMSTGIPLSRAGSLPQGEPFEFKVCSKTGDAVPASTVEQQKQSL
jgi:hypothetical protein